MALVLPARIAPPRYRWRIVVGGGLALAAVHTLLLHRLELGDFTPDLFSVFALYVGVFASRYGRYTPCLVLGLIRDFFSMGLMGSYGVLYSLLHKAASKTRGKLDPERLGNIFIMALIGTFLVNFGYHAMLVIEGNGIGWSRALARCAWIALATAPVAVLTWPLAHFLMHKAGIQRTGGYWNF